MTTVEQQMKAQLRDVYNEADAAGLMDEIQERLARFSRHYPQLGKSVPVADRVTQADAILITYGDQVNEADQPALRSLGDFLNSHLKGVVSGVHILPFYPYSSDDGFSVIDYKAIDPNLGDWPDLQPIRANFRLMFDAVINHISAQSTWFRGFLAGDPKYKDYFIVTDPNTDLSSVTRPRTLPLLTAVETPRGTEHVWTTFSPDQVDLNYENPAVLLEIIDVLLLYVAQGAELIRLDAIGFMWKEIGTSCIHLPQTHRLIQLFRTILNAVAPNVLLVTETNVPHRENISYFGDGQNEAQMVYNFTLAPLILHTFHSGDATKLQQWAANLEELPDTATYFNFIASHDGIGLRPVEGILTTGEVQLLVDKTVAHGGQVSYKTNPDGSQSPYELNVTLFDALSDPESEEPQAVQIDRFMATQAIMLALPGVPGIYVHSLFGSHNNLIGMEETGRARTINRQKWLRSELDTVLENSNSYSAIIFHRYANLLRIRASQPAFHPNSPQQVLGTGSGVFALLRTAPVATNRLLCLHNVTSLPQPVDLDISRCFTGDLRALISGETIPANGRLRLELPPYAVMWLATASK
jgi:glycosidase